MLKHVRGCYGKVTGSDQRALVSWLSFPQRGVQVEGLYLEGWLIFEGLFLRWNSFYLVWIKLVTDF